MQDLECRSTFIAASDDCAALGETPPTRATSSVAEVHRRMLIEEPYRHTQPEILFAASAPMREEPEVDAAEIARRRAAFFGRSQACLRTSPLARRYGWGIHFDAEGRAAAYAKNSPEYDRLVSDTTLTQTRGMRSRRG